MSKQKYEINDDGYFGMSLLNIGSYGSHLMINRVEGMNKGPGLYFDEATPYYHAEEHALTIEGIASDIRTPRFAIESLANIAQIARDMDNPATPSAS